MLKDDHVELISAMASDLMVVNAARVSFGRSSDELTEADKGLIGFLMRERHGTPFEHNAFTFAIKCPIFVAREWFRHRIGSFNEFSGRYATYAPESWTAVPDEMRTQTGKPGHYTYEPMDIETASMAAGAINQAQRMMYGIYEQLLSMGVAREQARAVLPVGMMTSFYWTVNARSLMNFLSLRTAENAQQEIREYATAVESIFASVMPVTYAHWYANGRNAP